MCFCKHVRLIKDVWRSKQTVKGCYKTAGTVYQTSRFNLTWAEEGRALESKVIKILGETATHVGYCILDESNLLKKRVSSFVRLTSPTGREFWSLWPEMVLRPLQTLLTLFCWSWFSIFNRLKNIADWGKRKKTQKTDTGDKRTWRQARLDMKRRIQGKHSNRNVGIRIYQYNLSRIIKQLEIQMIKVETQTIPVKA